MESWDLLGYNFRRMVDAKFLLNYLGEFEGLLGLGIISNYIMSLLGTIK